MKSCIFISITIVIFLGSGCNNRKPVKPQDNAMAFVDLVSDAFSNHDEDAIRRIECKWFYELPEYPDRIVEIRMKEILSQTISLNPGFRINSVDVLKGETTTSNESLLSTILSFSVNMESLSEESRKAKSTFSLKIISDKGKGRSKKIFIIPGTVTTC